MSGLDESGATVFSLVSERLKRAPVVYSIEFRHDSEGFSFTVYGVQDAAKDRLAVAADLDAAAASLRTENA